MSLPSVRTRRNPIQIVDYQLTRSAPTSGGSSDEYEQSLIKGVTEAKGKSITTIQTPFFAELYAPLEDFEPLPPMQHPSLEEIGIIIHSSGSTNFPKPIPLSHAGLLTWMRSPWYTDRDLCGQRFSLQPAPPYHAMGFIYACSFPFSSGTYPTYHLAKALVTLSLQGLRQPPFLLRNRLSYPRLTRSWRVGKQPKSLTAMDHHTIIL
jgi:acyl-CoA synthetase (AMP-forming)/AMP-acid ligase II